MVFQTMDAFWYGFAVACAYILGLSILITVIEHVVRRIRVRRENRKMDKHLASLPTPSVDYMFEGEGEYMRCNDCNARSATLPTPMDDADIAMKSYVDLREWKQDHIEKHRAGLFDQFMSPF